jgi:hypothetical protein
LRDLREHVLLLFHCERICGGFDYLLLLLGSLTDSHFSVMAVRDELDSRRPDEHFETMIEVRTMWVLEQ